MNPLKTIGDMFVRERARWVLWVPVGMGVGVAVYFAMPFEPSLSLLVATPFLMLSTWFLRHWLWGFIPVVALLTFSLGFNAAQIDTSLSYAPMLDRQTGIVPVEGRLMYTEIMPDGVRLTLKDMVIKRIAPEDTPLKIRIKFNNKDFDEIPPAGSRLRVYAQLGPFSDPVMPGAVDFRWMSYFKQLGGLGWSFGKIEVTDPNPPASSWHDRVFLLFENVRLTLAQHVYAHLSGDVAAMTAARLNGEQTGISKPVIEAMRISGLAHLLSTSGFHVTIMGILIYYPIRAVLALIPWVALRFPIKKWAAGGAIASTVFYTLLVGSQAATLRSMLMTCVAMLAIISDRRANAVRLVMLSATLAIILAPNAMLGPSFQMSFAAVFCLIAFHERKPRKSHDSEDISALFRTMRKFAHYMAEIFTTSIIATAATTPFALYHFQTFSFYGFIANMLALPMTSFWVMPNILIAYLTAPFNLDGWFIEAAGAGIWLTIKIATFVSSLPFSIFYVPAMPWFALVMIVIGGLWFLLWREHWRNAGLLPIIIGLAYPLYTTQPDILIAPDGKHWAARLEDGRLAVSNLDKDAFITSIWQQRLGMPPTVDVTELSPDNLQVKCDAMGCIVRHGDHSIAFPEMDSAITEDCEQADMVITSITVKDCAAKTMWDESEFWHHGAHIITFDGSAMHSDYVRTNRAMRPWSVGWGGFQEKQK